MTKIQFRSWQCKLALMTPITEIVTEFIDSRRITAGFN